MSIDAIVAAVKESGADVKSVEAMCELAFAINHHSLTKNSGSFEVHFDVGGKVAHCEHHEKKRLAQNMKG